MTASRKTQNAHARAVNTACPPRRSFVASDARRRGQPCLGGHRRTTAFGAALPTPATSIAGVDNALHFSFIVAG